MQVRGDMLRLWALCARTRDRGVLTACRLRTLCLLVNAQLAAGVCLRGHQTCACVLL